MLRLYTAPDLVRRHTAYCTITALQPAAKLWLAKERVRLCSSSRWALLWPTLWYIATCIAALAVLQKQWGVISDQTYSVSMC